MFDVIKTVGRYDIIREVGRGGMATVYLARQPDLDRNVALKELGAFHASDPALARRFVRESRVAGSLSHPNVVTVHDYFEHDGTPYIAMEYVERGSLRPYVGRLSLAEIGGVLKGTLLGLEHAHEQGVVHRDLKPENLMVTRDGRVKITDFGIARATTKLQGESRLTVTGMTVGTPTYMAPEQAMVQEVGPPTDLYSVGCMAFELLTGDPPFDGGGAPMAILLQHVNEPIPPVTSIDPAIDAGLADWVGRLVAKDPAQRTQRAIDAWDELEEIVIRLLGHRWRHDARLGDPPVSVPGPYTPPPSGPVAEPLASLESDAAYRTFDASSPPAPEPDEASVDQPVRPPVDQPAALSVDPPAGPPVDQRAEPSVARASVAATVPPRAAPPPDAPAAAPARRRRRALLGLLGVGVVVVIAALVALRGGGGDAAPSGPAAPRPGDALRAGTLQARAPSGWRALDRAPKIPGLTFRKSAAAAPGGDAKNGAAIVGFTTDKADNPALLPDSFTRTLGFRRGVIPTRERAQVGAARWAAYLYPSLDSRGLRGPVSVYVVPTSAGVVTVACIAPSAEQSLASDCRSVAGSLQANLSAYPLAPSRAYADRLNRILSGLNTRREHGIADLRGGRTPALQAKAAGALADGFTRAGDALARLEVSPAVGLAHADLTRSLRKVQAEYRGLSASARTADDAAYKHDAAQVEAREAAVVRSLQHVRDAGYRRLAWVDFKHGPIPPLVTPQQPSSGTDTAPPSQVPENPNGGSQGDGGSPPGGSSPNDNQGSVQTPPEHP